MKTKIMYDTVALLEILADQNYEFVKLPIKRESEDDYSEGHAYYFAKPEVDRIDYWFSMGETAVIYLKDGRGIQGLGSYVVSQKDDWVKLHDNDYISPKIKYDGRYIESTEQLNVWLLKHGVSQEELEDCSHEETLYETVKYEGVPTHRRSYGNWAYSSEDLVLDEREIEEALHDIKDDLLRKKIECILYARVFKRTRY